MTSSEGRTHGRFLSRSRFRTSALPRDKFRLEMRHLYELRKNDRLTGKKTGTARCFPPGSGKEPHWKLVHQNPIVVLYHVQGSLHPVYDHDSKSFPLYIQI